MLFFFFICHFEYLHGSGQILFSQQFDIDLCAQSKSMTVICLIKREQEVLQFASVFTSSSFCSGFELSIKTNMQKIQTISLQCPKAKSVSLEWLEQSQSLLCKCSKRQWSDSAAASSGAKPILILTKHSIDSPLLSLPPNPSSYSAEYPNLSSGKYVNTSLSHVELDDCWGRREHIMIHPSSVSQR